MSESRIGYTSLGPFLQPNFATRLTIACLTGRIAWLTHILLTSIEVKRTSIQTLAIQQLVVSVTHQTSVGVKTALTGRITLQTLTMFIRIVAS